MKIFYTEAEAEQYVQRFGHAVSVDAAAAPSKKQPSQSYFTVVGGSRPGIYQHEAVANYYAKHKDATTSNT